MRSIYFDRIKRCMLDARDGKELTIGFFGGSITQGSLATNSSLTYAYRVFEWWKEHYPKAEFYYVNGGIGGTSSHFGTARIVKDLLMYQPDFIVVDFSVNDDEKDGEFFQETYEGVIRQILKWPSKPAIVVLNNVFYDTGMNAQEYHNAVADYYKIPHVSIKDTIYQRVLSGEFTCGELTPDNLHPNDKGHELLAEEICIFLDSVRLIVEAEEKEEKAFSEVLPIPMTANAYEYARLHTIENSSPELDGFRADPREKMGHLDCFKNGWIAEKAGSKICFRIECSCIAVQYRKTIQKPSPVARVIVDGLEEEAVILDGNFDEMWGDCLYLQKVMHHGIKKIHTVNIEVIETHEDDKSPFYLLSLITA